MAYPRWVGLVGELPKRQHVREPPAPFIVGRPLDDESFPGLLYGWAEAPDGRTGGLRGLVTYDRPIGPGYVQKVVAWSRRQTSSRCEVEGKLAHAQIIRVSACTASTSWATNPTAANDTSERARYLLVQAADAGDAYTYRR